MFGHMVKFMLPFLSVEIPQHYHMGRAVTIQRLQWKNGAQKEICQECSVQRSS